MVNCRTKHEQNTKQQQNNINRMVYKESVRTTWSLHNRIPVELEGQEGNVQQEE